ncbi:MAG: DNA repair protein RecN [Ruminococcaceae bacterium]|nr:DNA repair protein RecN [Oscillospiraceae bacterium]
MLFALHIRNIALLDDVEIEFQNGLNVLTGETGAGKSILIGSINLLLGERANRELIRHGADRAEVSGLFYVEDGETAALLGEAGFAPEEDGSLLISRQILRDGKNICRIAGRTVTLAELKEAGKLLVNIHGQRDSQTLLDQAAHIHYLDGFLKEPGARALAAYQADYKAWKSLLRETEQADIDEAEKLRRMDLLTYEINEIRDAALSPEEEDELKKRRDIINHKKKLEQYVASGLSALSDNPEGTDARQALAVAAEALSAAGDFDPELSRQSERLQLMLEETEEVSRFLRGYFERLAEDEQPVDEIEERLDLIYRLKRKYGATVEDVLAHLAEAEDELAALQHAEERKEQLLELLEEARKKVSESAGTLTALRKHAVRAVVQGINENLHFLNMPQADFNIVLTEAPLNQYGAEQVSFTIKTNSGEDYRPLGKIVSGGELSRITLAIKSVLTKGDSAETLIFDEIDTGVSGTAAQKIGRKLRDLSGARQVLCVTHLAQIAAMAGTHFLIDKQTEDGRTRTRVAPLCHDERLRELARMISGEAVTETTLKQAEELIEFGEANG